MSHKISPPPNFCESFLKKLDFKRLNYVYIFLKKIFAGFLKNFANSVTVLTDVWQRPSKGVKKN